MTGVALAAAAGALAMLLGRVAPPRAAVAAAAGCTAAGWWSLRPDGTFLGWAALSAAAGAVAGGVAATALATGLTEDNASPPDAVRRQVRMWHLDLPLRYPPEPRGKRLFDLTVATTALALTLPLWFLIAALVWCEEPGPVLFTKNSVGRGGRTFRQVKFRSMRYRAEAATGPVASCPADPRALRVGRWLRRWHLDELPELLHVIGGTMSLVGPRPLRTVLVHEHLRQYPGYARRHTVRPGIACTAQIERYRLSPAERLAMDCAYIDRMSVGTDMVLLLRAVLTTARGLRDRTEAGLDRAVPPVAPKRPGQPTSSATVPAAPSADTAP
ncbi:MAG TPA: sugar transferase [Pilimelia sp.]|nr:sugar transferase [Pilimelia sp.]